MLSETAYAKINLALHVRRRRADGYHEIETLFAFVDAGDRLTAEPASQDQLAVTGEFADQLPDPFGNIVALALNRLPRPQPWHVTLDKRLPVAAGLGGGSADAAAIFRLVERTHGLPDDWPQRAARLGADVPACVASHTAIGRGTGTDLSEVAGDRLRGLPVLLVNPRAPVPTGGVYAAWNGEDGGPLSQGDALEIARHGRNDLQAPAIALCPAIADVLAVLDATEPVLSRMSGSGATCFALYAHERARSAAAQAVASAGADWWQLSGRLV